MTERRETALILGASKGLGLGIADACRARGWRTIEVARFSGAPTPAVQRGAELGLKLVRSPQVTSDDRATIECDLATNPDGLLAALHNPVVHGWHITHFFWVAGIWWEGPFEIMEPELVARMVDVNLRSALVVAQFAWEQLIVQSDVPHTFTTIASTTGLAPKARQVIYAATKWAQIGFTRSLALEAEELRRVGRVRGRLPGEHYIPDVRVRLFSPGGMRTHLFDAAPPATYETFMDPTKVGAYIVGRTTAAEPWIEETIARESDLGRSLR